MKTAEEMLNAQGSADFIEGGRYHGMANVPFSAYPTLVKVMTEFAQQESDKAVSEYKEKLKAQIYDYYNISDGHETDYYFGKCAACCNIILLINSLTT